MKLLRLWIEGLDEMLGGGLPDKSVIVMTGEPGSGYDILAQQIMYQRALHNEKVAYFSTSRSAETLKEDLSTFGWNIAPLEEKGNWVHHHASVADAIQVMTENIPKAVAEGRWVILDSLSYLILTQKYYPVVQAVELLLENARKNGGIHFLLLTQKMHDTETETTMQHLADGVMEFTANETAGGIDRRIRIKKMRRAVYEPRLIPFNITERGITIETAVRIV
ncbi:MAG TPA: RAD55 family ATPase [Candidatus Bathyarchaeia archaeon]|nr:RAD55 family ATPase [Candidatus Bathyarchaeia archaeon]